MNISKRRTLIIQFILTFGFSILHSQSSWEWLNPSLQGNYLCAVKMIDTNVILAAGDASTIVRSTDGGENWITSVHACSTSVYLQDMAFSCPDTGMIVGADGTILFTSNRGVTWSKRSSGTMAFIWSVAPLGNRKWIIATSDGTILRSTNDGTSWNNVSLGTSFPFDAMCFANSSVGVVVGNSGGALRTTDGGSTWSNISVPTTYYLRGVHFFDPDTGFVWGDMRTYFRTNDGGSHWIEDTIVQTLRNVCFINRRTGFATTDFATDLYKTTDGGESWFWAGSTASTANISFANENMGVSVGGSGAIFITRNGGAVWTSLVSSITDSFFRDISFADRRTGVVVGSRGAVFRTSDGGKTWSSRLSPSMTFFYGVELKDSIGFIVGAGGEILRSTDDGVTWHNQNSGTANPLNHVNFKDSIVIAVGDTGIILRSTNLGESWSVIPSGTDWGLLAVQFFDQDTIIIAGGEPYVGYGGLILRSTDKGVSWTQVLGVTPYILENVAIRDSIAIATSLRGEVFVSKNFGRTWVMHELGVMDDLYGVALDSQHHGIVVTGSGGVFTTSNLGTSWKNENSATANWLYDVCYVNPDTAIMVGVASTILQLNSPGPTNVEIDPLSQSAIPGDFVLHQNFPNPFNPTTVISYRLPANTFMTLKVYDLLGREVGTLISKHEIAGFHKVIFNAGNLPSGVYFYRIEAGNYVDTKKFILLK
jgi:photosystem II stability/assembly factor-like uncharacterized protein